MKAYSSIVPIKSLAEDVNLTELSISEFIVYYNANIPETFPQASFNAMKEFQNTYPSLFKDSTAWIIDRHRKKVMDWLTTQRLPV